MFKPFKTLIVCAGLLAGLLSAGHVLAAKPKADAREAKYRGPNGETWAGGLGRKPEWVRAVLAAGKSLEDYRI